MKKYILISDFCLTSNNRGTAALGYGAISFLFEKGYINESQEIVIPSFSNNPFRRSFRETKIVQGKHITFYHLLSNSLEFKLFQKMSMVLPFTSFGKFTKQLALVAALNGGDGFSDIYGTEMFLSRLFESKLAMTLNIPLIFMPQTAGPFKYKNNFDIAIKILKYSKDVFVRDRQFIKELNDNNIKYEVTKDLSAFMKPEPWDISIDDNSVGINVSGLAYSNQFKDLAGRFDNYPELIYRIIKYFQNLGVQVYLIPHAYNYFIPESNNDDMLACREVYENLEDKTNIHLIDKDLISPQIKYIISKMSFFCGTRMHANFAAIYSGVPVFGLAYSYKFEGAFVENGQDREKQIAMINNLQKSEIVDVVKKIEKFYHEIIK